MIDRHAHFVTCFVALVCGSFVLAGCGRSAFGDRASPASQGKSAVLSCLPMSLSDGKWKRAVAPTVTDESAELVDLLDGAAPRYLNGGWVASVNAQYTSGGEIIDVTVHDMGRPENAAAIFGHGGTDAGTSEPIQVFFNANADTYYGRAISGRYVFSADGTWVSGHDLGVFLQALIAVCR